MASTSPTTSNQPDQSINHPAHTLLQRAHAPNKATTVFTDKIKNKPLLLHPTTTTTNPTSSTTTTTSRAKRRKIRAQRQKYHVQHAKPRPLSAKEKRKLNLHALPTEEVKYSTYTALNKLWTSYMLEVLGYTSSSNTTTTNTHTSTRTNRVDNKTLKGPEQGSLLISADFHGMSVEVVRCRDVDRVGLRGIVVRETKGTLVLVTPGDRVRRVLKDGAVFRVVIELPTNTQVGEIGEGREAGEEKEEERRKIAYDLIGSQLLVRPADRATKKFKWHTVK